MRERERGERRREREGSEKGGREGGGGYVLFFGAGGFMVHNDGEGGRTNFQKTFLNFIVVQFEDGRGRGGRGRGEAVEISAVC